MRFFLVLLFSAMLVACGGDKSSPQSDVETLDKELEKTIQEEAEIDAELDEIESLDF